LAPSAILTSHPSTPVSPGWKLPPFCRALRFVFRKQHARQLYGSICAKVRQVHRQMEQQYAAASPEPTTAQPFEEPPPMPPTFVAE